MAIMNVIPPVKLPRIIKNKVKKNPNTKIKKKSTPRPASLLMVSPQIFLNNEALTDEATLAVAKLEEADR